MRRINKAAVATATALLAFTIAHTQAQKPTSGMREWPFYGGDQGGTKYSPLTQINRNSVRKLQVAWQWKTGEKRLEGYKTFPGMFEVTPVMAAGTLYLSTPYNRGVALGPGTGGEPWWYDP